MFLTDRIVGQEERSPAPACSPLAPYGKVRDEPFPVMASYLPPEKRMIRSRNPNDWKTVEPQPLANSWGAAARLARPETLSGASS